MTLTGRTWKYGDNINTDVIFPGKYTYTVTERSEIARHALEDLDPAFAANVRPGDIIVAGRGKRARHGLAPTQIFRIG